MTDVLFGATCFFNSPGEFELVAEVARKYPLLKYVEFRGEHPFLFPGVTPGEELARFKEILKKTGLKSTVHTTMYDINLATLNPWLRDANIACYKKYLDIAEFFESEIIVLHAGFLYEEFTHSPLKEKFVMMAEENLCETLLELADYGEKKGVKVALENSPPAKGRYRMVDTVESHIHILEKINHPNLGALFDFAHAFLFKFDLIDYLEKIRPYLIEIHAHNNLGKEDDHLGLPNGKIDYQTILNHPAVRGVPFIMEIISYEEILKTMEWLEKLAGG